MSRHYYKAMLTTRNVILIYLLHFISIQICSIYFVQSIPSTTAASPPRIVWELFKTSSEERERVILSKKTNEPSRTAAILLLNDQHQCQYTEAKVKNTE